MAQITTTSHVRRNSQRGVGTACQSRVGSHSQGCHWRKRLESCIEIERDKDTREGEEEWRMKNRGRRGETCFERHRERGPQGDRSNGQVKGKKEKERLEKHSAQYN